jgi:hypothetical protein
MVDNIKNISAIPQQLLQSEKPLNSGIAVQALPLDLPVGTELNGFIINRDNSGNPVLRTNKGDLTLTTNLFLKIGTEVNVRIENTSGNITANIQSVNGQSPQLLQAQSNSNNQQSVLLTPQFAINSSSSQNTNTTTNNAANITNNSAAALQLGSNIVLSSRILGTVIANPVTANTQTQLQKGDEVSIQIQTLQTPNVRTPPQTTTNITTLQQALQALQQGSIATQQPAPKPTTTNTKTSSTEATAASENGELAVDTPDIIPPRPKAASTNAKPPVRPEQTAIAALQATDAEVDAISAAPAVTKNPDNNRNLSTLSGTVIANAPNEEAIIRTPVGIIRLQSGTSLPVGSQITFEITDVYTKPNQSLGGTNANTAPLFQLAQQWTSLQSLFSALSGTNIITDTQLDSDKTTGLEFTQAANAFGNTQADDAPTTLLNPQSITAGLLSYLMALRNNNSSAWLGKDTIKWLEDNGHEDILNNIESEFQTLSKSHNESLTQSWQALFFPLNVDGYIQQIRLFVKNDEQQQSKEENAKQKKTDTRFIVELDLSKLGEIQLDGFIKKDQAKTQFDMIIRSLTQLPNDVQRDISTIYNETGASAGYKGTLIFQSVKNFPVNPMDEITGKTNTITA